MSATILTPTMTPELTHVRAVWEKTKDASPIYQLLLSTVNLTSAIKGRVVAQLPLSSAHVNSRGTIHGAVSAAIVDWSGGMAIATHGFEKTGASVDIHVSYLATAGVGDTLEIVATADKVGKSMAFTSIVITRMERDGKAEAIVAKGSHTKFLPVTAARVTK